MELNGSAKTNGHRHGAARARALAMMPAPRAERDPGVTLVVSVDTEEDNWIPTRSSLTARNVLELPRLDALFRRLGGVRATYFTTYAVVQHPDAVDVLRSLEQGDLAEIGAHLHPWNTPPLSEPAAPRNTMLKNLAPTLQLEKLRTLTRTLEDTFSVRPRVFRAGRYGLGASTVPALVACDYEVDSSVTPLVSWEQCDDGPNFVGAPRHPYRLPASGDIRVPDPAGSLLELPLSCTLSRAPAKAWARIWEGLHTPAARRWRLKGVAARLGIVRQIILNPEVTTVSDMLLGARLLLSEGLRYIHLTLHSPSLMPGLSPFVRTTAHRDHMLGAIERFVAGLAAITPLRFATVSEAACRAEELMISAAAGLPSA